MRTEEGADNRGQARFVAGIPAKYIRVQLRKHTSDKDRRYSYMSKQYRRQSDGYVVGTPVEKENQA